MQEGEWFLQQGGVISMWMCSGELRVLVERDG